MNSLSRRERDESGFTLVEVLTISIIIGVLSSIAIPLLHSQTSRAQDATAASDLRNAATAMESYFSDHGTYGGADELSNDDVAPTLSKGSTIMIMQHAGTAYCLAGLRNQPLPGSISDLQSSADRWYDSAAGGLQPQGATGCPVTTAVADDWQTDYLSRPTG
jgi:type IV pilus assembly protein PilA